MLNGINLIPERSTALELSAKITEGLIIRVVLSVLRGALKSLPALSFNALIIPILRNVYTISFHYSCPWISYMSCIAFKITR